VNSAFLYPWSSGRSSDVDAKTVDKLRRSLEEERERLVSEIEEMEREGAENLSDATGENNYRDHMADQGTATFSRELDMGLVGNSKHLLEQVEKALVRLDEGEYGTCQRCGKDISVSRLEAVPAAELCIACKEWEEAS
jgi:RNA polymerase-binding protein DksA